MHCQQAADGLAGGRLVRKGCPHDDEDNGMKQVMKCAARSNPNA
jgi:hypothetical protein